MLKKLFFFIFITLILSACTSYEDDPLRPEAKLIGYWALSHIETINHDGGLHSTTSEDIPLHIFDAYVTNEDILWDVLIFDGDFATVRGDMPNRPKAEDYNLETTEGQIAYNEDLEEWFNNIGSSTDQYSCPVGSFSIMGSELFIGTHNMGNITFLPNDTFKLEYKKTFDSKDKYRVSTYTYTRIYSLTI